MISFLQKNCYIVYYKKKRQKIDTAASIQHEVMKEMAPEVVMLFKCTL